MCDRKSGNFNRNLKVEHVMETLLNLIWPLRVIKSTNLFQFNVIVSSFHKTNQTHKSCHRQTIKIFSRIPILPLPRLIDKWKKSRFMCTYKWAFRDAKWAESMHMSKYLSDTLESCAINRLHITNDYIIKDGLSSWICKEFLLRNRVRQIWFWGWDA